MRKLLQINSVVNYGSTGRIAEQIGQIVSEQGWESYIAFARNKGSISASELIKIGNSMDIAYHGLRTRLLDQHGLASKKATLKLIDEMQNIKPDIIHLHNLHGYYLNFILLFEFMQKINIPVVWTFHDCWPFTGHCAYTSDCEKWKVHCNHCPQKKEYPASWWRDNSSLNFKLKKEFFTSLKQVTIVTVSQWLRNNVSESFLGKYPIEIINNGIDTEIFKPRHNSTLRTELNLENKAIVLGVSNIWDNRKGFQDFLNLRKRLNHHFEIVLIGLKESQLRNLPNGITGIGHTADIEKLAEFYSIADAFCNPTWEDSFPTTNLESLSCGTPVITYNTGGSIESVSAETGSVIDKGDIDGLVSALMTIHNRGKIAYTDACRNRAVKMYNMKDQFKRYFELYDRILKK